VPLTGGEITKFGAVEYPAPGLVIVISVTDFADVIVDVTLAGDALSTANSN
jgi:hypothetical protein